MALSSRLVKPDLQQLIRLEVRARRRLSPHWVRLTLGDAEIDRFRPMGYDQWFRLFLPLGGESGLDRIPAKANTLLGYLSFLRIPDGQRPLMRNYTVRHFRPAASSGGPEIDVDFVLHGADASEPAGPASRWASRAEPGESVVIIDEGLAFNPARGVDRVLLVADESGLPAMAGVCASLPSEATGLAILEVPDTADALPFDRPAGVELRIVIRDHGAKPGAGALVALGAATDLDLDDVHAWIVGEQALPTAARRHLVERGMSKDRISFCGYWRVGAASPTPRAYRDRADATP